MSTIRVLLCDDHLLIRASLKSLLAEFPGRSVWVIEAHGDLVSLARVRSAPPT